MTQVIKGFASHALFTDNTKDVIHPFGEISTYSLSYAKDKGIYSQDDGDIRLYTFNTTVDDVYTPLDAPTVDSVFEILNWMYDECLKGNRQWTDQVLQDLIDEFSHKAHTFKCGVIVDDGNFSMVEWLSWIPNGTDDYIRIWFADESFRRQYDQHEIVVIPPIENVDKFFLNAGHVKMLLDDMTAEKRTERVQAAKDFKPETIIVTKEFLYHDPSDPNNKIPTQWDLLIYGEDGNNIDSIKEAIKDYILGHSQYTADQWKPIFPDIFKRTEFVIVPRWDSYAIPNRSIYEGIYSPVCRYSEVVDMLKDFCHTEVGYTEDHIKEYATFSGHPYRSLSLLIQSNPENRDNQFLITDVFGDFISENTLSQDFNRMSESTREFAEALMEMIILAEDMTKYTLIPRKFTKLLRNNKLYVVWTYRKINYLVAAKRNFTHP